MAAEGVRQFIFSSTRRGLRRARSRRRSPRRTRRSRSTRTARPKLAIERALPHFERAYGIRSVALRYFNAAGADPDGELGEDHAPEIHLIPRAIDAASGGAPLQVFGDDYPTPDGTCLRDYIHVTDLAHAHVLALDAPRARAGRRHVYNLGNGRPHSVREVIDAVERVTGRAGAARTGAAARRRSGGPVRLERAHQARAGWTPRFEQLDTIVETAWRWRRGAPARLPERSVSAA